MFRNERGLFRSDSCIFLQRLKYWVVNRALAIFDTNDLSTQKRAEHFALSRELDEIRNFTEGLGAGLLEDARSSPQAATLDQANYIPNSELMVARR